MVKVSDSHWGDQDSSPCSETEADWMTLNQPNSPHRVIGEEKMGGGRVMYVTLSFRAKKKGI